jgi:hypothetical protein
MHFQSFIDRHTGGNRMKKLCIASGLVILLLVPICSSISLAGGKKDLAPIEPAAAVDFDFVVLAQSSSTSVTANLSFPLAFQVIPILLVGEGSGTFGASLSRSNTSGEIIYIYQRFPGAHTSAFNIGITPLSRLAISSSVTLGPGWAIGYVITGILFSPETPDYIYTVSLSF